MQALSRFLGDSPFRVLIKLIVVSFLVGLVMSAFGWSPYDILYGIQSVLERIWRTGFATLDSFLGYILLGAAIVVPIFLLIRITRFRG
ncbi:MAG: DUF6460 domain-containing protein [Rhizobiaceae bacterium]|nr:hypothetical protein [Hyphomicrobiales bacterium]MCO5070884.1 DUF6460 domain-containing protein [Rhizobiaceae bacterium]